MAVLMVVVLMVVVPVVVVLVAVRHALRLPDHRIHPIKFKVKKSLTAQQDPIQNGASMFLQVYLNHL